MTDSAAERRGARGGFTIIEVMIAIIVLVLLAIIPFVIVWWLLTELSRINWL